MEGKNPRKAVNPDRLRMYMDTPTQNFNKKGFESTLAKSWNQELVDSRPFSRLNHQPARVLNFDRNDTQYNPLVRDDYSLRKTDLKSNEQIVMNIAKGSQPEHSDSCVPILQKDETFAGNNVQLRNVVYTPVPKSSLLEEGLMHPKERRQRNEFQVMNEKANAIDRVGRRKENRLHQIMRSSYASGVLGYDGPTKNDTQVYKDHAQSLKTRNTRKIQFDENRRKHIQSASSSRPGQSILESVSRTKTADSKIFNSKGGRREYLNTESRLFDQQIQSWNTNRAQNLRNQEGGRSYNILNGSNIEYFPPTTRENTNSRQAHPSISIHGYLKT